MEVKGIAVASIPKFVQHDFGSRFNEWIDSLSKESQTIMKGTILMSNWYPMQEAVIEPTSKLCDLFYSYQNQGAWDAGRFSADYALKGIYKIFVKFGSPEFLIKRASRIMTIYYRPSKLSVPEMSSGKAKVHISEFSEQTNSWSFVSLDGQKGHWRYLDVKNLMLRSHIHLPEVIQLQKSQQNGSKKI